VRVSAFAREQNGAGLFPLLTTDLIAEIQGRPLPRILDRALRGLAVLVQQTGYNTRNMVNFVGNLHAQAVSYCASGAEMLALQDYLIDLKLLKSSPMGGGAVLLTSGGIVEAEQLSQLGRGSIQGFVAMSFDHSMDDAFTFGFDTRIRASGYRAFRIDLKDHINGVSDEIISEIKKSRFLVADYTLLNNGAYFEAGVAVGLGMPVIPTCRADYLDKLHFDIKHINTLVWHDASQLNRDLARRIAAVIGQGPVL
jgi:hypothetical protein